MSSATASTIDRGILCRQFHRVRQASVEMCRPLKHEDFRLQPMEDVSPPWWTLGHTSWFFVRNVLRPFGGRIEPEDDEYEYLLNSYYASFGARLPRARRGLVTRPTTEEIYRYRDSVDRRVDRLLEVIDDERLQELAFPLTIGLHHEQQHQELFYTEIKCIRGQNPPKLREPYCVATKASVPTPPEPRDARFIEYDGGLFEFGNCEGGWCWDNELPVHKFYLAAFAFQNRLVTNGEYLQFIDDGGYRQQLLWLDNGWTQVQQQGWAAPLYWERIDGQWQIWTLAGMRPVAADEPVCHVSFYEADAFARWASETFSNCRGARLPSEREWEHAARWSASEATADAFLEGNRFHPAAAANDQLIAQMSGVLWQWTTSYYDGYPGYQPFPGPLAEYNAKFMDNQRVLRGGSCVTPRDHYRLSYRNFWPGPARFQFTGIRLARNVED